MELKQNSYWWEIWDGDTLVTKLKGRRKAERHMAQLDKPAKKIAPKKDTTKKPVAKKQQKKVGKKSQIRKKKR